MNNILVIDDEPLNIKLIKAFLEDYPYNVISANNGADGLEILHGPIQIDLILLDRMMPEIDGLELAKLIKKDPALKNIPIIMQTAAAEKYQVIEGMQAGILHYITKPFDEEDLTCLIHTLLQ
jgi:CheY-like chemotaxis protein